MRREADTVAAKAKAILAWSKEAYRVALLRYREALPKGQHPLRVRGRADCERLRKGLLLHREVVLCQVVPVPGGISWLGFSRWLTRVWQ